ncbi:MAG: cation transporting ATPase C-terminal domain-containing protein, partial [Firmicutes bacterium]|nr:cation transporting ATPase C-terminal domain-containing protein [Bacillota bacterium]
NIGEVITVFMAMLLWHKTPLLSMQLLWINLVTDSLPAIALGMEAVEADVMNRKPKAKGEGIFAYGLGIRVVLQGFMFAVLTLIGFRVGESVTGSLAGGQTLAFMVLALSQVIQAFNMRSDHSLFKIGPFTNHKLNWAVLASVLMVLLVLFTPIRTAFGLVILPGKLYLLGAGLILVPLLVMEFSKAVGLIKHQK